MSGAHMTGGAMDPLPTAAAEADCDEEADFPAPGTALGPPAPRRGAALPAFSTPGLPWVGLSPFPAARTRRAPASLPWLQRCGAAD